MGIEFDDGHRAETAQPSQAGQCAGVGSPLKSGGTTPYSLILRTARSMASRVREVFPGQPAVTMLGVDEVIEWEHALDRVVAAQCRRGGPDCTRAEPLAGATSDSPSRKDTDHLGPKNQDTSGVRQRRKVLRCGRVRVSPSPIVQPVASPRGFASRLPPGDTKHRAEAHELNGRRLRAEQCRRSR